MVPAVDDWVPVAIQATNEIDGVGAHVHPDAILSIPCIAGDGTFLAYFVHADVFDRALTMIQEI